MKFEVDFFVEESGRKSPKYTLETDLNGEVSLLDFLEFTKSSLIVIADEVLKEEQAKGFEKTPEVVVDGRANKPVSQVSPLGSIEFTAKADMKEIIMDTYMGILGRAPVLTGEYLHSNYVFLNGTQVATDLTSLKTWLASAPVFQENDLIRFVNIAPYARKLERLGVTIGRQQSRTVKSSSRKRSEMGGRVLAPNGTYFLTTRAIRSKYKRNSVIAFSFISGSNLGLVGSFKATKKKKSRPYLYPTITISVKESGIA